MWQRCKTILHRCHMYVAPCCQVTGLLVAVGIEPFEMPVASCESSPCSEAGILLAKSWNGASTAPPLASVPT